MISKLATKSPLKLLIQKKAQQLRMLSAYNILLMKDPPFGADFLFKIYYN
jgi:hypothetical protein